MHRYIWPCAVAWLSIVQCCCAEDAEKLQYFESKVRPILAERCFECHSGAAKKLEANLRLDHGSFLATGGDSGSVVADGTNGLLMQAVRYEGYEMPPSGKLPDNEVAILQKWIDDGATWPEEPIPEMQKARVSFNLAQRKAEHWAWQPRTDPSIPNAATPSGSTIDCFVNQAIESHGLKANRRAERAVLVRRAYLDVLGIPPNVAQLEKHMTDADAAWYERMIDALLASPQFGVRFGRHWFDLVRYAESRGHEFDEDVPGATFYRDYVIRALNDDLPYDQFVTEQIAGDLIPKPRIDSARGWNESLLATGFWHLGEWVHSPVDTRKDEMDRFDNMVDVFSKSVLGLTVACARCHDHKFDAIGTADYYALLGFLRSSHYRMVRFETSVEHEGIEGERWQLRESMQADVKSLVTKLLDECASSPQAWDWLVAKIVERCKTGAKWRCAVPVKPDDQRLRVDFTRSDCAHGDPIHSGAWICEGPGFGKGPVLAGSVDLQLGDKPQLRWQAHSATHFDSYWAKLKSTIESVNSKNGYNQVDISGRTLLTPTFELSSGELSYLIRGQCQAFVAVDSVRLLAGPLHGETRREFREGKKGEPQSSVSEYRWVTQPLQRYRGKRVHVEFAPIDGQAFEVLQVIDGPAPELMTISVSSEELKRAVSKHENSDARDAALVGLAMETITAGREELLKSEFGAAFIESVTKLQAAVQSWQRAVEQLAARTRWESRVAMGMIDGTGENHPILIRGSPEKDGPIVERRFLEALEAKRVVDAGSGRLQLAREITDARNPLTARVLVNRLWHHLLGRGIVATTDDFGVQGQRPTHPELLDHLATRLVEGGWSIKRAVRSILLSDVYQRSSVTEGEANEADPDNLWLARARVRRLEGEAIRDTLMSVAGRLDVRLEGGSVPVHLTDFLEGRGRPAKSGPADGDFRRSVFIAVRRNFLVPMLTTFDAPNPSSSMGRRNVSSVPAQSLTLLNDPLVHQLAKYWIESLANVTSDQQRLELMYLSAFSRRPTADECEAAMAFIAEQTAAGRVPQDAWQDLAHVLMNMKEMILRF